MSLQEEGEVILINDFKDHPKKIRIANLAFKCLSTQMLFWEYAVM